MALQVARSTLWRRLKGAGVKVNKYTDISDDGLDSIIAHFQFDHPNCGHQEIYRIEVFQFKRIAYVIVLLELIKEGV